jgi:hypothetical protein
MFNGLRDSCKKEEKLLKLKIMFSNEMKKLSLPHNDYTHSSPLKETAERSEAKEAVYIYAISLLFEICDEKGCCR